MSHPRLFAVLLVTSFSATAQVSDLDMSLSREAFARLDAREARIAALKTPEALLAYQKQIRAKMLELIGGLPTDKTPLNPRVTGGFRRKGYRVENVAFESQPGFRVTANFYVPDGAGPFPAVLGVAGHSDNGKASATYQHAWIGFARRGYAVLAYDPPGQGERLEYFDPETGRSKVGAGTAEHIKAGQQCLLTGSSVARYFIWDGIRAFDYLLTRPEVDAKRIAVAGNSGGGTQAAYLSVFEPRLAAVVASCYMTSWRELWKRPGPQDAEQIFPGFLAAELDFPDFAAARMPGPFLMTTAIQDFFPIAGARATHQEIVRLFERLGASERAGYFEYDDVHGWSKPRRQAAYRFLDKWLLDRQTDGAEPEIETEPESRLLVTPTGQLSTSFGSETVQSLNAVLGRKLSGSRGAVTLERVKSRLAVAWTPTSISSHAGKPAVLTLGVSNVDQTNLEQAGFVVVPVNVRGAALLSGRESDGYSPSYQMSARAWLLGKSLAAMQVGDVLDAFKSTASRPDVDPARVSAIGYRAGGPIVLMAAAIEPSIRHAGLESSIVSYADVVAARIHRGLETIIIPGVLRDFDLPDLVRLSKSKAVRIVSPVHPNGAPLIALPRIDGADVVERPEGWTASRIYGDWLTQ